MCLLPKELQNILLKEIITMNSNMYSPPNANVQLSLPTIKLIKYAFGIKRLKIPKIWQHFPTKPGSFGNLFWLLKRRNVLVPKLFWPTVRKNCSGDREKLLKFEAEGREFAIYHLKNMFEQKNVSTIFGNRMLF